MASTTSFARRSRRSAAIWFCSRHMAMKSMPTRSAWAAAAPAASPSSIVVGMTRALPDARCEADSRIRAAPVPQTESRKHGGSAHRPVRRSHRPDGGRSDRTRVRSYPRAPSQTRRRSWSAARARRRDAFRERRRWAQSNLNGRVRIPGAGGEGTRRAGPIRVRRVAARGQGRPNASHRFRPHRSR